MKQLFSFNYFFIWNINYLSVQLPFKGSTEILPSSWNWDPAPCFPGSSSDLSGKFSLSPSLLIFFFNFILGCKDN
jgi:hypothetical protein